MLFTICSIHLCCTMLHTKPGVADTFIKAVSEETAIILKDPNAKVGGIVSTSINGIFPSTVKLQLK